ncbi:methyl-accepting chemotaxis protein [Niveibacterium terrae]|uniref:methyl-accepting chemotaxis protein n=1 Tax=Niveibacterium terrae TaxID=3373598 RepID=UPI003A907E4D
MTIKQRLHLLCAFATLALLLTATITGFQLAEIGRAENSVQKVAVPLSRLVNAIAYQAVDARRAALFYMLDADPAHRQQLSGQITTARAQINRDLDTLNQIADEEGLRGDLKALASELNIYFDLLPQTLKIADGGDATAATAHYNSQVVPKVASMMAVIERLHLASATRLKTADAASEQAIGEAKLLSWTIALIVGALLFCGGIWIARGILGPLGKLNNAVISLTRDYDFGQRVPLDSGRNEISETLTAYNRFLETMQQSLRELHDAGATLGHSSGELKRSASELTTASSETSSATTNMAAAVEEMTVSIAHVAERASETDRIAHVAGEQAAEGVTVIDSTVDGIHAIAGTVREASGRLDSLETRTGEIGNVVKVIKEIADQTSLLALNAAIEAARAGETGRGFAVVADEVRKLAERTTLSTQEITSTVETILAEARLTSQAMQSVVTQVEQEVADARQAGEAVEQIRTGSSELVSQVGEISSSMREQSAASNNIAQQIERVAQMSEETSAAAHHTSDSAQELDLVARKISNALERYKV